MISRFDTKENETLQSISRGMTAFIKGHTIAEETYLFVNIFDKSEREESHFEIIKDSCFVCYLSTFDDVIEYIKAA